MEAREGYKKTELGWIPEDWDCVNLGDVALIKGRIGWKGLKKDEYTSNGPFLIAGKHIKSSVIDWNICDHISEERYVESMEIALENGDTILTKDGSIGNPAFVDNLPGRATINSTMLLVRADGRFIPKFVFFQFQSKNFNRLVREKLSGSSIPHIFQRDMVSFNIPLPPLPEQQKIAEILTTVDDKISSIEERIQQTEQLKKGLMEKLLTEGIGHTEFKDTEIGRIPKSWDVLLIKDFADVKTGNTPPTKHIENYGNKYPWITPSDISITKNINISVRQLSEKGFSISRKLPADTVLITCIASIGKNAILRAKGACNQQINGILPSKNHNSDFIYYWFENNIPMMLKLVGQTAVPIINKGTFEKIPIALPPLQEQKQIADILSAVDDKLDILRSKKANYETLKKGLMEQLLTGKIRVKV